MVMRHVSGEAIIHKVPMGSYGNNGYLVVCPRTNESIIIDTPAEPEKLLAIAKDTTVKCILITHTHQDHLLGFEAIRSALSALVGVHPTEASNLPSPPDFHLLDGDTITIGTVGVKVIHTPGHTSGSLCFLSGGHLFTGDTLFPGGPGNTRTPKDLKQILGSITQRLLALPENTVVYPGHGNNTTVGDAQVEYAIFASRTHPDDLCGDVHWLRT
ncbi:MAG: MBL fold metallo-hydrolase [Chloroflexi bacterium]|nr:MBL fold metallo-hydrolase [Chloroflexota bacterium]MBI4198475.1 MBL fold metallo-hydrolase [Chloroflexota bacterium]